jgi:hypothetical protein
MGGVASLHVVVNFLTFDELLSLTDLLVRVSACWGDGHPCGRGGGALTAFVSDSAKAESAGWCMGGVASLHAVVSSFFFSKPTPNYLQIPTFYPPFPHPLIIHWAVWSRGGILVRVGACPCARCW